MFLTHLQTEVKARLLELKQLELILDDLGLIGIIRKTLVDNGSLLIDQKDDIVREAVEKSTDLIKQEAEKIIDERVIGIAKKKK